MKRLVIFQWVEGGRVCREERMFAANDNNSLEKGILEYKNSVQQRTTKSVTCYYPKIPIVVC